MADLSWSCIDLWSIPGLMHTSTCYSAVIGLWDNAWEEFIPFLDYDAEIHRRICSTDEMSTAVPTTVVISLSAQERGDFGLQRGPQQQLGAEPGDLHGRARPDHQPRRTRHRSRHAAAQWEILDSTRT
jgi:Transposase, Mutator family